MMGAYAFAREMRLRSLRKLLAQISHFDRHGSTARCDSTQLGGSGQPGNFPKSDRMPIYSKRIFLIRFASRYSGPGSFWN